MSRKMHIEIEVDVDYDVQPFRAATRFEPEEPFELEITSVMLDGIELAESVNLEEISDTVCQELSDARNCEDYREPQL